MAQLLSPLKQRFFDSNGNPLVGGKLFSYAAGTSTPLATYIDFAGVTQNPNPTILDSSGQCDMWIGTTAYKFVLTDANDIVQFTVDNVSNIADGSIGTAKLANNAVTTLKIADDAITEAKIAPNVVVNEIPAGGLTTAKYADGSVTHVKRGPLGQQISSSSGVAPTTSATLSDITNLTVTLTTSGRPVRLFVIGDNSVQATWQLVNTSGNSVSCLVSVLRNGTQIDLQSLGAISGATTRWPPGSIGTIDVGATSAGTYTYKLQYSVTLSQTFTAQGLRLVAHEL